MIRRRGFWSGDSTCTPCVGLDPDQFSVSGSAARRHLASGQTGRAAGTAASLPSSLHASGNSQSPALELLSIPHLRTAQGICKPRDVWNPNGDEGRVRPLKSLSKHSGAFPDVLVLDLAYNLVMLPLISVCLPLPPSGM